MISVERSMAVGRPCAEVLRYLADFGNTVEWDPGTEACVRLDPGPVVAGARWRNTSRFRGRQTQLEYRLEEYRPDQVVFVGHNRTVTATDRITTRASADRTLVVYRASLRFHGLARLAAPFLRAEFERLADAVAEQLPRVLAQR
ncbi:SRPBCC family protein [Kitasatospora sp. NPDC094015]|uniref:SRPBCC family protein n=1 Tax=Kitasatospora sp. NPDC094015 TaxID=3155205 RepID=UPI00332938AE